MLKFAIKKLLWLVEGVWKGTPERLNNLGVIALNVVALENLVFCWYLTPTRIARFANYALGAAQRRALCCTWWSYHIASNLWTHVLFLLKYDFHKDLVEELLDRHNPPLFIQTQVYSG